MAIKTKAELIALNNSTFTTNGVRDITGAKHKAYNQDEIDTFYTPAGVIMIYPSAAAPAGWNNCDGSTFSKASYPDLFAALGGELSPYGVQATTFQIPSISGGMTVVKNGGQTFTLNAKGGETTHVLTESEMPKHTHIQDPHDHPVMHAVAGGDGYGAIGGTNYSFDGKIMTATNVATNKNAGGGFAHNNMPPYITMNYIIKLK